MLEHYVVKVQNYGRADQLEKFDSTLCNCYVTQLPRIYASTLIDKI